jgi:uncharacterized protein YjgD (DUF1641 family)/uncharacterized membrane protein
MSILYDDYDFLILVSVQVLLYSAYILSGQEPVWLGQRRRKWMNASLTVSSESELRLQHLIEKMESIEHRLGHLSGLVEQAPGFIAMAGDTVDALVGQTRASGIDVNERLQNVVAITEALTRAETVRQLSGLLELSQQAPGLISMVADTLDSYSQQAKARGLDMERGIFQGLEAAVRLSSTLSPERVRLLERLLDSLDERVLGSLTQALEASQSATPSVGMMGVVKQMNDPDVQRTLGFLTRFAKVFGQGLK